MPTGPEAANFGPAPRFAIGTGVPSLGMTTPPTGDAATTLTIGTPADVAENDLLIAQIAFRGGPAVTVTPPAGWNLLRRDDVQDILGQALYYRLATAAEDASYTWTLSPAATASGGIIHSTNVYTLDPIIGSARQAGVLWEQVMYMNLGPMLHESQSRELAFYSLAAAPASLSVPEAMTQQYLFENPLGISTLAADYIWGPSFGGGPVRQSISTVPAGFVAQGVMLRPAHRIIIRNRTVPAGSAQEFAFDLKALGDDHQRDRTFSLKDGEEHDTGYALRTGSWTAIETVPEGWDLTSATCDSGATVALISLGGLYPIITCTFTNTQRGSIRIAVGEGAASGTYSFELTGGPDPVQDAFQLATGEDHDSGLLKPGSYRVAATLPEGVASIDIQCDDAGAVRIDEELGVADIDLAPGGTVSCAFTGAGELFPWSGFLAPVGNPPLVNTAKAGQSIPIRFSLGGDRGLDIFVQGYPQAPAVPCNQGDPTDEIVEVASAGSSGLSYDAVSDTYSYIWKTDRAWSGTCRSLVLKFVDGGEHTASFHFNR